MAATAKAADAMRAGASKTKQTASNALETYDFYADAALDYGWDVGRSKFAGDSALSKAGQVGTMLTVVTLGLVIIIGILVYSEVETALPAPDNTELNNASDNATSDFGDAMELAPVVLIVLIASLVLAVVQNFRS
jgi:hypothetical protein